MATAAAARWRKTHPPKKREKKRTAKALWLLVFFRVHSSFNNHEQTSVHSETNSPLTNKKKKNFFELRFRCDDQELLVAGLKNMSEQAAGPSPGTKKKRKKKKRKNNTKPGSKPLDARDLKSSVAVDAGGASTCTCHFTRANQRTNCNAESTFLRNFEDRIVGAINGSAELLTEWTSIVTRGKEYLTRFANLLLESEQLEPEVFAETMAETHEPLGGGGIHRTSTWSVPLRDLSTGKRAQVLAAIQQDLFGIHDRLAALQRRRAATVRLLAEDVDCCLALELQGCLKPGVLRTTDPVFKTLGLVDFYRLLAKISAMYEQELVLKQVKISRRFVLHPLARCKRCRPGPPNARMCSVLFFPPFLIIDVHTTICLVAAVAGDSFSWTFNGKSIRHA